MIVMDMAARIVYRLASLYTRHVPVSKGKAFLVHKLLSSGLPGVVMLTSSKDGRKFEFNSKSGQAYQIFFWGTREVAETALIRQLIYTGDVVIDLGANIGWYTSLFSQAVGQEGRVVAVEPVPSTFAALKQTLSLNCCPDNVLTFQCACSNDSGAQTIFEFPNLHPGLSSGRRIGNETVIEHEIESRPLDQIIQDCEISRIQLLKIDIEGGEFSALRSGQSVISEGRIESILLEANDERATAFGYDFIECLEWIAGNCSGYRFFRVSDKQCPLIPMADSADYSHGDNLFVVLEHSSVWKRILQQQLFAPGSHVGWRHLSLSGS